ncbi:HAD-IA family hydrolase [Actinoplanes sp. NPDC026619]|uniref:HAD family hydrolase n=1 Tax=Actinoplanes sp. NPDC026619 TaxID=3155798 RepID=UPI0033CAE5B6
MRKAIIFDLDGTIIDTETPEFVSWQEIYAAHGTTLDQAVWSQSIGTADSGFDPYNHLASLTGKPMDRAAIRTARHARFDDLMAKAEPLEGIVDWLDEARDLGLRIGLASSSGKIWVGRFLDALGLRDRFEVLATRDRVERSKPAPDLYELALHELGALPSEALAVEDSPNGIAAAKAAGVFCVAVPNPITIALSMNAADVVLNSLTDHPLHDFLDA